MTSSANLYYCLFEIFFKSITQRLSLSLFLTPFLSLSFSPSLQLFALCWVFNMQIGHFCPWAIFFGRLLKYANTSNKNGKKERGKSFIWAPGVFHSKKQMRLPCSSSGSSSVWLLWSRVCLIKKKETNQKLSCEDDRVAVICTTVAETRSHWKCFSFHWIIVYVCMPWSYSTRWIVSSRLLHREPCNVLFTDYRAALKNPAERTELLSMAFISLYIPTSSVSSCGSDHECVWPSALPESERSFTAEVSPHNPLLRV